MRGAAAPEVVVRNSRRRCQTIHIVTLDLYSMTYPLSSIAFVCDSTSLYGRIASPT
ncbi:hypothetical protein GY45DRAFT_651194 [Cubamyces sp. BRFM 1775]|nr:hypothetical protein GY45DRAFT_651194 [Cubamyces sp. BRFM 1775]